MPFHFCDYPTLTIPRGPLPGDVRQGLDGRLHSDGKARDEMVQQTARCFRRTLTMFYSAQELSDVLESLGFRPVWNRTIMAGMIGCHCGAKPQQKAHVSANLLRPLLPSIRINSCSPAIPFGVVTGSPIAFACSTVSGLPLSSR